jgi:sugar phosphate isomerase/epimerase
MLAAGAAGPLSGPAEAAPRDGGPPFRLGTVTYNVPKDWEFDALLKILPAAGVEGVELRTTHSHGVEPSLSPQQRAEVKRKAAGAGLVLWGLGTTCEFHSPDAAVVRKNVEECRQFVLLARDLGVTGVKVRPNGLPKEVEPEKTLEQIGRALRECGQLGQDQGVEIWVEVHGGGTQEPANMLKIMQLCGHSNVGVNWNSNRTDLQDGSVRAAFAMLQPYLKSCHINNLWDPGYPYRELFTLLREADYRRFTLCEVGQPVRPEDGQLFFACYRGLWRELARP